MHPNSEDDGDNSFNIGLSFLMIAFEWSMAELSNPQCRQLCTCCSQATYAYRCTHCCEATYAYRCARMTVHIYVCAMTLFIYIYIYQQC